MRLAKLGKSYTEVEPRDQDSFRTIITVGPWYIRLLVEGGSQSFGLPCWVLPA